VAAKAAGKNFFLNTPSFLLIAEPKSFSKKVHATFKIFYQ